MRRVAVGAAVVLLLAGVVAGCGGAAHRTASAPPVAAVRESLPDPVKTQLDSMIGLDRTKGADLMGSYVCVGSVSSKKVRKCTAAELVAGRASEVRYQGAVAPAPGEEPTAVAALRLPYGFRELLIAWRSTSGLLCMSAARVSVGTVDTPFGPCVVAGERAAGYPENPLSPRCRSVCLSAGFDQVAGADTYYLAGIVPPSATALRVTVGGGDVITYPLRGPLLPGTTSRVFMANLGGRDWRRVELVRGKTVVATETMSPKMAAFWDCQEKYADSDRSKLEACSAKARALPGP
jgi:hypothetical protein